MIKQILSLALSAAILAGVLSLPGCVSKPPSASTPPVTTVPATSETPTVSTPPASSPPATTEFPAPSTPPATTETPAPSTPPVTTEPPVTPPPSTVPPVNSNEMIGTLYTRGELMAMENVSKEYGPGITKDEIRPSNPVNNQSAYGKYGASFIAPDNGKIYLTFDCGYEHTIQENGKKVRLTAKILDVLKEKEVKAVFFVTMYYCKENPDLVRRMIDEGHAVGNHTNNHPVMPSCSIDKMVYEVTSLHDYVLDNFGYTMTLFRPPTGAFSTRSLAVLQSLGYETVNWSFAYADWDTAKQPTREAALKQILGRSHSGAIYLLHAVSATNATILGEVIDSLTAKGYTLELFQ